MVFFLKNNKTDWKTGANILHKNRNQRDDARQCGYRQQTFLSFCIVISLSKNITATIMPVPQVIVWKQIVHSRCKQKKALIKRSPKPDWPYQQNKIIWYTSHAGRSIDSDCVKTNIRQIMHSNFRVFDSFISTSKHSLLLDAVFSSCFSVWYFLILFLFLRIFLLRVQGFLP